MSARTILLIDFDPLAVEATRRSLVEAGYQVEVATDGVEGLKAFERTQPDLVLIEPMVPKKHGFQVCREIKGSARGPMVPVLITTAFYKGRKHKTTAREHYGCDDYLEKPIAQEDLLAACRRWVDERASEGPGGSAPRSRPKPGPVALDELSDEEIIARLDAMIEVATGSPASEETPPAHEPEPEPVRRSTPAVEKRESPPVRAIEPPPEPIPLAPPPIAIAPEPRPAPQREPRRRSAESAVRESGTTRAVVGSSRPPAVERASSSRTSSGAIVVTVVAAVLILGAGAAWWWFSNREPAAEPQAAVAGPVRIAVNRDPIPPPDRVEAPIVEQTPSQARERPVEEDLPQVDPARSAPQEPEPAPVATVIPVPAKVEAKVEPKVEPKVESKVERKADREPPPSPTAAPVPEEPAVVAGPPAEAVPIPTLPAPAPTPTVTRGALVLLEDVDEAPIAIRKDPPSYPPMARNLRQQGTVTLRLLVGESGDVEQAEILQGIDGRFLNEAALRAARGWRYQPATVGDVPVKVWITEQVVFRL